MSVLPVLIVLYLLCMTPAQGAIGQAQQQQQQNVTSTTSQNIKITPELNVTTSGTKPNLSVASEGGTVAVKSTPDVTGNNVTHMGREHVIDEKLSKTNVTTNGTKLDEKSTSQKPMIEKPEIITAEKNDHKGIVPKKGVDNPPPLSTSSSNLTTTTTKVEKEKVKVKEPKKKPLITEDIDVETPLSNIPNDIKDSNKKLDDDIHSIEAVETQKKRQVDYVVPIVAVILSVPLVAIIISVLYKRGSEWWQHRHYRRMDFLIEGMYNN